MTGTDNTFKKITNNDIYLILQEVRDEVKKTNGRVTRAEQRLDDIKDHFAEDKADLNSRFSKVWAVIGGIISAMLAIALWIIEKLF